MRPRPALAARFFAVNTDQTDRHLQVTPAIEDAAQTTLWPSETGQTGQTGKSYKSRVKLRAYARNCRG